MIFFSRVLFCAFNPAPPVVSSCQFIFLHSQPIRLMRRICSISSALAALALAATPAAADPISAPEPPPAPHVNTAERAHFPPELYPGLERHSTDAILLTGLATLYPGRIVRTPPAPPVPPPAPRAALSASLPNGVDYVRCYANGTDAIPVPEISAPTSRIIDLRYFATGPDAITACANLCEKLTGTAPRISPLGDYPLPPSVPSVASVPSPKDAKATAAPLVIVLVNHGTAGPIEAMLADLQARKAIFLVGTATAGQTANYRAVEKVSGWWRIVGEIQPASDAQTLVGTGVAPATRVAITPDNDLVSWQWIERGTPPETILRLSSKPNSTTRKPAANTAAPDATDAADAAATIGTDLTLRRGYDILVALQVMHGTPASNP
jgi:hypothetical protein